MKKTLGGIVVITILIIIVAGAYSYNTPSEKTIESYKEVDKLALNVLERCTSATAIDVLELCRTNLSEIRDECNEPGASVMTFCTDPRVDEFYSTVDMKINNARSNIKLAVDKLALAQKNLIDHCSFVRMNPELISCKTSMLEIKKQCEDPKLSDTNCNDPRIDEILNKEPIQTNDIFEYANESILQLIDTCLASEELSKNCIDTAKQILEQCAIDSTVPACSDPRLKEITNADNQFNEETEIQQFTLDRMCEQNRVCVVPGDYLTYSIETPNMISYGDSFDVGRGNLTYYFENLVNQNDIKLKLVFISEEGNEYSYSGLMDLTTGFLHDFPDDANQMPIGGIKNIPFMVENISSVSGISDSNREFVVYEDKHSTGWYNGQQSYRNAVFVKTDDYPQIAVHIDKETKIVVFSSITAYGGYIMLNAILIDTNIL